MNTPQEVEELRLDADVQTYPNRGKKVCIVEDDIELLTILERVLRSIDPDIETDWATSVEEAFYLLRNNNGKNGTKKFDLIIADIFLEGERTGIDLWKICQDAYPNIPLVVISALPVDKFLSSIGRESISPPFLPKPFSAGECKQVLGSMLEYNKKKSSIQ